MVKEKLQAVVSEESVIEADWRANFDELSDDFFFNDDASVGQGDNAEKLESRQIDRLSNPENLVETPSLTFAEWLELTEPVEDETSLEHLPQAFQQAEKQGVQLSKILAEATALGFSSIGSMFGSLAGIIGSCGPICLHSISSLASGGSSALSVGSGLGLGMSLGKSGSAAQRSLGDSDKNAKKNESDATASYSNHQDLSKNKTTTHSSSESTFGNMETLFGFGIFGAILNGLLPGEQLPAR